MSQDIDAEKESTEMERRLEQIRAREREALQPREYVPEIDPEIRELQERVEQLEKAVARLAQDSDEFQCDHCSHGKILAAQGVGCCWFPGDPERGNCMHYVSVDDDTAHLGPFSCVRACRHCGVLISGGPTACLCCAEKPENQG